jgi:hypothetical protein
MTRSTTPARRWELSRIRVTRLLFWTAHNRLPFRTMPSTPGTLIPAMLALLPVRVSTVCSVPLAE